MVILDFDGHEVVRNPAAVELGLSPSDLRDLRIGESHDYRTSSGMVIRCSCRSFIDRGVEHRFYLAEDISGSVAAAERGAYEKVIRVMAHEVNNTMAGFSSALSTALPEIDDKEIHLGDIMGIGDDGILAVGRELGETTLRMMEALVDADSEIIGVYFGEEVSEKDAQALGDEIAEKYPDAEVEVHYGGQPIYYYVISVE